MIDAICNIRKVSDNHIILTVDSFTLLEALAVTKPKPKPKAGFKKLIREIQSLIF